ncbi:hypothetical protein IKQ26_09400 [bacterium]|nr:hypothetical protein [bacterium]
MTNTKKLVLNIILTFIYAVFTLFVVLHHEVWVDEVQVWQIAKYLNIFELFKHLVNEGHPSLFYLILMPFAKMKFSILAMQIICWLSSTLGVFLLLHFSPFKWWSKLAIILSAGFLYYFPVIARNYSLLPLLVFGTAVLYDKRKEKPVLYSLALFLISQVHVIMFAFVALLTLYFGLEAKKDNRINGKTITAFSLMCLGLLLVIAQLCFTIQSNSAIGEVGGFDKTLIVNVFVEFFANTLNDMSLIVIPFISFILWGYFLFMVGALFKKSKKMFFLVLLSVGFQLGIYVAAYPYFVYGTRIFSAYLILIFAYWIVLSENNKSEKQVRILNILLAVLFFLSTYNGFLNCYKDIKQPYSGSAPMAQFILKNIDKNNSVIFYQQPNVMVPLIYYLEDYDTLYVPYKEDLKFVKWDKRINKLMSLEVWGQFMNKYLKENEDSKDKEIYILQRKDYYLPVENTEIIFVSEGYKAHWENFVLSKFNNK